jgi:hypothetical protein
LSRIFGTKREEDGWWREFYNDLNNPYYSPNIVRVVKSRRMRWEGHVARMAEVRGVYGILVGGSKLRDCWEDQGVDGRIKLRWTLGR